MNNGWNVLLQSMYVPQGAMSGREAQKSTTRAELCPTEPSRKAGQCVLTQVGHDGRWRQAGTHLWESQACGLGNQDKVADDSQSEAETKSVTLDFRHADEGRGTQAALDLNQAPGFTPNAGGVSNFCARVKLAGAEQSELGLTLHLSGPWPPYSFVPCLPQEA